MSNSFYMDKILNKDNPNDSLIIDFKYPSGAAYRNHSRRDVYSRPKLCFSEHPFCRRIGIPGYYDTQFLFYNDLPSRLTNLNAPPVTDLQNSPHVNQNFTDFIVPPITDLVHSSPVESTVISNIHPHFSGNLFQTPSSFAQKQGFFPIWHNISELYSEQIQNKSSALSELTKNTSKNGTVRDNGRYQELQKNEILINSKAVASSSKNASEKSVQVSERYFQTQKNDSLIISNADSSTSKQSSERSINSSKTRQVQIIDSSETIPVQVMISSKALPNQVINPSERSGQALTEQVAWFSTGPPEQVQDISRSNPITKKEIFSRWGNCILDDHAELSANNSRILSETLSDIPRANIIHVQNAFPDWYSRFSTSLGEADVKEEFPSESDRISKRRRTTFSSAQLVHLEKHYVLENRYLTRLKRIQLATDLGLSEKQVKVWFQNRRVRDKPKDGVKSCMQRRRGKIQHDS